MTDFDYDFVDAHEYSGPVSASTLKTAAQVKKEFERAGVSVTEWARAHKFERMTVVDILRGKRVGKRGEAHEVAIALGMKDGVIVEPKQFFHPPARRKAA